VLAEGYPPAAEALTQVYGDPSLDAAAPWTRYEVPPGYEGLVAGAHRRPDLAKGVG